MLFEACRHAVAWHQWHLTDHQVHQHFFDYHAIFTENNFRYLNYIVSNSEISMPAKVLLRHAGYFVVICLRGLLISVMVMGMLDAVMRDMVCVCGISVLWCGGAPKGMASREWCPVFSFLLVHWFYLSLWLFPRLVDSLCSGHPWDQSGCPD